MKTSSAKSKGRALQNKVRDKLLETFPELEDGDVRSCPMGSTGEDIILSPAARKLIPYSFECKKHKSFSVYKHYDQAVAQKKGEAVVVIEADRRKPLVILDLNTFLELIKDK